MSPYIVSAQKGELSTANGLPLRVERTFADDPVPDIVCVPDFPLPPDDPCTGRFEAEVA